MDALANSFKALNQKYKDFVNREAVVVPDANAGVDDDDESIEDLDMYEDDMAGTMDDMPMDPMDDMTMDPMDDMPIDDMEDYPEEVMEEEAEQEARRRSAGSGRRRWG